MERVINQIPEVEGASLPPVYPPNAGTVMHSFSDVDIIRAARPVKRQRQYAFLTVITPSVAFVFAIAQIFFVGVSTLDITVCLVMYFLTLMGITVGFHRYLAHRSFKTSTTGRFALAILGSMAAQGPVLHWVSNHRRHHRHSDQPGDPHSPNLHGSNLIARLKGFFHAHIGSMFAHEVTNFVIYSPDLVRDRVLMFVNRTYIWWVTLGIALPAIVCGLVTRSWIGLLTGFLWGGMVRMVLVHHAIWSITSLAHMFGVKRYNSRDQSRNSLLLALVTGGEGWHNHHHAFPSSALFTEGLWKIDIGGMVIRFLRVCGLVWDLHSVTPEMKTAKVLQTTRASDT